MGVTVVRPARLSALLVVGALGCAPESEPSPVSGWDRPFAERLVRYAKSSDNVRDDRPNLRNLGRTPTGLQHLRRQLPCSSTPSMRTESSERSSRRRASLRLDELIPNLLIVGVGYPVGSFFDASAPRAVDLTPTQDRDWEIQQAEEYPEWPAPEGSGGAPEFLQFLRQELIPSIDAEFRTNPLDRALFGHSFGGLFAIHALLNGEGTFQRFIAGSPSLWWDDDVTFRHEEAFAAAHAELPARSVLRNG